VIRTRVALKRTRQAVKQTDDERRRDLKMIRWTGPLLVAVFLPTSITEAPRYWYIAVVIAVAFLICYVQVLRIEKEREDIRTGRQTARRAKAIKKALDKKDRHGAGRSSPPRD
jgi:hypothetical protein